MLHYWRELGALFITTVCTRPDAEVGHARARVPPPAAEELEARAAAAAPMTGAEYLTDDVLGRLWDEMDTAFRDELSRTGGSVQERLRRWSPAWNLVGRIRTTRHGAVAADAQGKPACFTRAAKRRSVRSGSSRGSTLSSVMALDRWAKDSSSQAIGRAVDRSAQAPVLLRILVWCQAASGRHERGAPDPRRARSTAV